MRLDKLFYWLGYNISKHPVTTILLSVCVVGFILSGMMFLSFDNDPQKLWVPQDSNINHEQIFFNTHFGAFFRINQIMLKAADSDVDLFTSDYLEVIYKIQSAIEARNIIYQDQSYNIKDLCYKPISTQGCMITSPMEFWKMSLTKMKADPNVKNTAKCLKTEVSTELPCVDRNGIPIIINTIFGGSGCIGNEVNDSCNLCSKTAKSLMVTFLLNNNFYTNKIAEQWEKEVFIAIIDEFNRAEESRPADAKKVRLVIDYMSERSIPDDLNNQNAQNILVVILSYCFMFVYIAISMGNFPSLILSKFLVALGGIFVVVFSFLSSLAIVSFFGVKLSLISAEVVPFLVLAIGVDNMFIIVGAKDRKPRENIHEHMGNTLKEVGPSITTAAVSECLAFFIGYLTKIPALQSFCLAASFAILIDYILQITMFFAIVTLDEMRIREKRYDIFPCIKSSKEIKKKGKNWCTKFLSGKYYDFLLKVPVQIGVLVFYLGLIACAILGLINLNLGLDPRVAVIQGGNLDKFLTSQIKYGEVGPPAYLILNKIDYNNPKNLEIISEMVDDLSELNSVQPPVYSWYKDFSKFMQGDGEWQTVCNPNIQYLRTLPLEIRVREFINIGIDSKCCKTFGLCGEAYKGDIFFSKVNLYIIVKEWCN